MSDTLLLTGLVGLFAVLSTQTAASPLRLTAAQADALARKYGLALGVDPAMIRAIIDIESSRNPLAVRLEVHVMDASVGLMQTLYRTAHWLWKDMGYRGAPEPTMTNLTKPEISVYYGTAYLAYLANYKGIRRSEQWIVESYNAGPGNRSAAYWAKYQKARGRG